MKPGFKQTEVGIFPEDWCIASVKDFGSVVTGGTPPTAVPEFWGGDIPWVTPTDIGGQRDILCSERSVSELGLKLLRALPADSVLVTCIASIGKNAVLRIAGACNQQINAVVPKAEYPAAFLYYIFDHGKDYLLANSGITATRIISKAAFEELLFAVPPSLAEREAIAEALGNADALIESLERLIAKKRDVKQGAMQELLTARRRLPGFTGKWETKRLGTVSEMGSGGTPSSSVPAYYDGDIPWVSISDMTKTGKVIMSTDRNISRAGFTNSAAQMFPAGTVLYAMYASLGECCIAGISLCSSQAILGIRPHDILDKEFLFYFLSSIKSDVKTLGQQGTQANLNKGMVQDFLLCLPSRSEQAAITAVLSDMDAEIAALEAKLSKARAIKQGMMQELLTGRIRLK